MDRLIKVLFFALLVKPVVLLLLGLNVRGRNNLPKKGPAIVIANHNSHLDTLVLLSLFPLSMIHKVRPVAAADYFLGNGGFLAWVALKCIGIIPLDRSGGADREVLFSGCTQALSEGDILVLFPEGSRGKPEQLSRLKKGVYYLIKERADIPVVPTMLHGLGRALPKGEALLVPFNCDVVIGENLTERDTAAGFMNSATASFQRLSEYCITLSSNDSADDKTV
ncbi:lysophospholipid acyltransferase family protein [Amphritea sp. 2_MG-2023]|uniref:lysophospholipid acyltransferase family protein n=1 Tax=Amphritea TaxID=515417 RepID=UPI001C076B95|nr:MULTISPECIES: lysophospholipid acyltransferase family protein [Amphritea]MBU2967605.1 1-acyl-sn-glycerol-3-phosphate acyltransferase [Amphritea atlantica]MDO6419093.1 lysophospholipid acyltransferase family protein [Amphritea sp. 2_MG-2023]